MSWLVIILLVLIIVVFTISCIVIIVWLFQGAPNVSVSNSLVTSALDQGAATTITAVTQRKLLATSTGGFVLATGKTVDVNDNRLVETVFLGGQAVVTKTTPLNSVGTVATYGPINALRGADIVPGSQKTLLQPLVEDESEPESSDAESEEESEDQPEHTVGPHSIETWLAKHPDRIHLFVAHSNFCSSSTNLTVPVRVLTPSQPAQNYGNVYWTLHRVQKVGVRPDQELLWKGVPFAFETMSQDGMEVSTSLRCMDVARDLLRLKLVEAQTGLTLSSTFVHPQTMVGKKLTMESFGFDVKAARDYYLKG